jgi:hypothetical protein
LTDIPGRGGAPFGFISTLPVVNVARDCAETSLPERSAPANFSKSGAVE